MIPEAAVVLHAGAGHEMTFLGYLSRVALSLVAVGGVAFLVHWSMGQVEPDRPALASGGDEAEKRD